MYSSKHSTYCNVCTLSSIKPPITMSSQFGLAFTLRGQYHYKPGRCHLFEPCEWHPRLTHSNENGFPVYCLNASKPLPQGFHLSLNVVWKGGGGVLGLIMTGAIKAVHKMCGTQWNRRDVSTITVNQKSFTPSEAPWYPEEIWKGL